MPLWAARLILSNQTIGHQMLQAKAGNRGRTDADRPPVSECRPPAHHTSQKNFVQARANPGTRVIAVPQKAENA